MAVYSLCMHCRASTRTDTPTHSTRTEGGTAQFCRGALEHGHNTHTCRTYTTLHYGPHHAFHFCDEHPARAPADVEAARQPREIYRVR